MNVRRRQKHMDARMRRPAQRLPSAVHVALASSCQPRDNRPPHRSRDALHGFKVAVGGNRKSSFDYIDAKTIELLSQTHLFLHIHTASRRLFAVTKRSVENGDARAIHRSLPSEASGCSLNSIGQQNRRKDYYL